MQKYRMTVYRSLYYPAAGYDFEGIAQVASSFPTINKAVLVDVCYKAPPQKGGSQRNSRKNEFQRKIDQVLDSYSSGKLVVAVEKTRELNMVDRKIGLSFYFGSLQHMDPALLPKPAVHLVKVPGDNAHLSWFPEFYSKIISDMTCLDLLLVSQAMLPLPLNNLSPFGLQHIDAKTYGLPKAELVTTERKFKYVRNGFACLKKAANISREEFYAAWNAVHKGHQIRSEMYQGIGSTRMFALK